MTLELDQKVRGGLVIAILILVVVIMATPIIRDEGVISLPRAPLLYIEYMADIETFVVRLYSATGENVYRNITLEINGEQEHVNWTYTLERHTVADHLHINLTFEDDTTENRYAITLSITRLQQRFLVEFIEEDLPITSLQSAEGFIWKKIIKEVKK